MVNVLKSVSQNYHIRNELFQGALPFSFKLYENL